MRLDSFGLETFTCLHFLIKTVNTLLSPPPLELIYFKHVAGGLIREGGLFQFSEKHQPEDDINSS